MVQNLLNTGKYTPTPVERQFLMKNMKQGNDVGSQYRSAIYCYSDTDILECIKSKEIYQIALSNESFGNITTEIMNAPEYFLAEEYHQQYLAKNPNGYCGLGGTGCSIDL